jgi:CRP/FNR family transcriptional regulator, cyclic AMP receptor protein
MGVEAMVVPNTLAAHPCFKTLDPDACRVLDRQCVWLKTPAGAWLIDQSASDRDVYFIMTGHLRAVLNVARQDLIFSDMHAGSIFGELAAFDGAPRALSVFAVNDSVVAKMPGPVFVETMFSHRPLAEAVISTLIDRLRAMTARVGELGALNVRARVQAELLRLARPDHDDPKRAVIVTPPNQSELAARINTRRETVSREINALERNGLIERRRGAIVITDALRLSAAIEAASSG